MTDEASTGFNTSLLALIFCKSSREVVSKNDFGENGCICPVISRTVTVSPGNSDSPPAMSLTKLYPPACFTIWSVDGSGFSNDLLSMVELFDIAESTTTCMAHFTNVTVLSRTGLSSSQGIS